MSKEDYVHIWARDNHTGPPDFIIKTDKVVFDWNRRQVEIYETNEHKLLNEYIFFECIYKIDFKWVR